MSQLVRRRAVMGTYNSGIIYPELGRSSDHNYLRPEPRTKQYKHNNVYAIILNTTAVEAIHATLNRVVVTCE